MNFDKMLEEKSRWELHKDAAHCFEQILEAAPYKTAAVQPLTSYLTNHLNKKKMLGNAGEVRMNQCSTFSTGLLHVDAPVLSDQQKLTFINSVQTLNANLPRVMADRDGC